MSMRYEYKVVQEHELGQTTGGIRMLSETELNKLGRRGWRLLPNDFSRGVLVFMREQHGVSHRAPH